MPIVFIVITNRMDGLIEETKNFKKITLLYIPQECYGVIGMDTSPEIVGLYT